MLHEWDVGPGSPVPLGATPDANGVNFAIFSAHATAVDLCLFTPDGSRELTQIRLQGRTGDILHSRVGGVGAGQLYGYRVHGEYAPERGHRFNPNKLLIDPYARLLSGPILWDDVLYGSGERGRDERDSASAVPKSIVVAPSRPLAPGPRHSWSKSLVFEAHVKGLTQAHPDIPPDFRGTFEGLAAPPLIEHLIRLGVTAVELMPIQAFSADHFLVRKGLGNYWGYSTLAFFAPEGRYLGPAGPAGLRSAVAALHEAGIEVILDVVYNHTAELDELGPTLSFRGIDNASYYRLQPDDPGRYVNDTGCGNTLNVAHPQVAALVVDSLRHWVVEYGVDGFRFDLATTLGREPGGFSANAALLTAIAADPILAGVKLIAEPWDLGEGGYRLGGFPGGWAEWNDRFRDAVRSFWRGDRGSLPAFTQALTGSRDIFEPGGRGPEASLNYVACHDGFTLHDLVSFEGKHNEANLENNRDGHDHNLSQNNGVEGPTEDPAILRLRQRQKRNLLASLFVAQGTPMLGMGDELSRSQLGNNNAYCQDNDVSWLDWSSGRTQDPELPGFVAALAGLRGRWAALRRSVFFTGEADPETGARDVHWFAPDGREMQEADWHDPGRLAFGMEFGPDDGDDERLLLLANASGEDVSFRLWPDLAGGPWAAILDTADPSMTADADRQALDRAGTFALASRSLVLFRDTGRVGRG